MSKFERMSRVVWRLVAPNPGPMTLSGTNTYLIIDRQEALVIDPGPDISSHLKDITEAAEALNSRITKVLVTHGHPDHYPGAESMQKFVPSSVGAFESASFQHDEKITDNQYLQVGSLNLKALHTPGHAADHLCFYLEEERAIFTGDNVLGNGTSVIAPPKGNMRHYLHSLKKLQIDCHEANVIYGGHGEEINEPARKLDAYLSHREMRMATLLTALEAGEHSLSQLVLRIYRDIDRRLLPVAARQVMAQLLMLEEEGRVTGKIGSEPRHFDHAILTPEGTLDPVALAELGIGHDPLEHRRVFRLVK